MTSLMPVAGSLAPVVDEKPDVMKVRTSLVKKSVFDGIKVTEYKLNQLEKFLADAYIEFGQYGIAGRMAEKHFGYKVTRAMAVKRLKRQRVQRYIDQVKIAKLAELCKVQFIWERYSGEEGKKIWLTELIEMRSDADVSFEKIKLHEMIGTFMGYKDQQSIVVNTENAYLDFRQADMSK